MTHTEKDIITRIGQISALIEDENRNIELLIERAKLYLKLEKRDMALNDFRMVTSIEPEHVEANSYIEMIMAIDDYFYNQTYNV